MKINQHTCLIVGFILCLQLGQLAANPGKQKVSIGPRPYYLVDQMADSPLKEKLAKCAKKKTTFRKSDFSIGHRGAPLQFPEHTLESYLAGARMGAGILECDVTFTKDRELVCRHSQCDLHTTTNILAIPELAAKCSEPFIPADPETDAPASAKCCTSDITLEEFKQLQGKMDASDSQATTVEAYMGGTAPWRTNLYSSTGTLLSHRESIELFKKLNVKMTPELKSPSVPMPYQGDYTQQDYAQQMIDEYKQAGIRPRDVYAQSFNLDDVKYWIAHEPEFGKQSVYLDGRYDDPAFDHENPSTWSPSMEELVDAGVQILAPPMWMLVTVDHNQQIAPSTYAKFATAAGLDLITWTLERAGQFINGGGWYYQTITEITDNEGDTFELLDVLAKQVGVIGVFSDWPATTTFYANCNGLR